MEVDPSIHIEVHDGVYEPAEDSYLLLEAVEARGRMLDMGTGTGIVGLHAACHGSAVIAADVDGRAVENARWNARWNDISMEVVQSDLFEGIEGRYDVIAFNPPYLPARDGDRRWDGGRDGVETARRFLNEADDYLAEGGCIYLLLSTLGDVPGLIQDFRGRYRCKRTHRLPLFFERLLVFKVTR